MVSNVDAPSLLAPGSRALIRPRPRMSVTKLSEYLSADPLRRREIIRDQRRPRTFITSRYARAEAAAIEYLVRGCDHRVLAREAETLQRLVPKSDHDRATRDCCLAALDALPAALELVNLTGVPLRSTAHARHPLMLVAGATVSVRPEIVAVVPGRRRTWAGGLKLYFSKDHPLDGGAGRYLAGEYGAWLIGEYLRTIGAGIVGGHAVRLDLCFIVDVFGSAVYEAPRAHTTCRRVLEVSCQEIVRGWSAP